MQHLQSQQHPLPSGFSGATTAEEVIRGYDLSGKTAIVTGGYSGLGKETAKLFREAGARVIVPARDVQRAKEQIGGLDVELEYLDLLDPSTITQFAERFLVQRSALDILVNCAGIMATPFQLDSRGYEIQFATNHLGHFQLTTELWPALLKSGNARIISVSSRGHHFSQVVFDDLFFQNRDYDRFTAYGQSKTANVLFAVSLDNLGKNHGIRAFSVHPGGIVGTGLDKHLTKEELMAAGAMDQHGNPIRDVSKNLKTIEQGASTQVWCAVSSQLDGLGAMYCENTDVAEMEIEDEPSTLRLEDRTVRMGVKPYAIDPNLADQLWKVSEELVFGGSRTIR